MNEKQSETELSEILYLFDKSNIFYSPNDDLTLKDIFKTASKTGNGRGIPDRIYYNKEVLIVFECKKCNLNLATSDLKIYKNKMNIELCPFNVYFVAFVGKNNYRIYDESFKILEAKLIPQTFGLLPNNKISNNIKEEVKKIHNYIYDNTKISNEDKSFFIAIILISLQKESFRTIIKNYNSKTHIYDLLVENLKEYNIDISVFEFLRNDNNNLHFLFLVNQILELYENSNNKIDLLNIFYTEFTRYNNSDSSSLGIVLTPEHVADLMVHLLNVNTQDIILDLCSGTGIFLIKSLKYTPKYIIGCEYQNKLFTLLKSNFILHNINKESYALIKGDCFEYNFSKYNPTKSIINPPYGMKDKDELNFVLKQLNDIQEGGFAISIIPLSKINKSSKLRKELVKISKIKTIIICNNMIFYPSSDIKCCILLLEKSKEGHIFNKDYVKILDYSDDGFIMSRGKGRIKSLEFEKKYLDFLIKIEEEKGVFISLNEDWSLFKRKDDSQSLTINKNKLLLTELEINYRNKVLALKEEFKVIIPNLKEFKITDLFSIKKNPDIVYKKKKYVNLISAKKVNNGIKEVVISTPKTFTRNKLVLITGGNGGAGLCFYMDEDFMITSATIVLSPLSHFLMDKQVGIYCAHELSKYKNVYSRGYQWSQERIKSDTLLLPINQNGYIDYNLIHSLFNRNTENVEIVFE